MTNVEKHCSNCDSQLREEEKFCHQCGQKFRTGKPTLWMILGDFFSSLFNLDSGVYKSFLAIFKPGKLTSAFLQGRIKSYAPPVRVFIVSSVFMVAVLSAFNNTAEERNESDLYIYKLHKDAVMEELKELKPSIYQAFPDSSTFQMIDTIVQHVTQGEEHNQYVGLIEHNTEGGSWSFESTRNVPTVDVFRLTEDSLFRKYNVEGFLPTLIARQQIKNLKDGDTLGNYIISRITIQALVMMPIVALILKLLYWRRNYYFVDHFVFSLHYHSFAFILLGALTLVCYLFDLEIVILIPGLVVILLYLFLAMKQVYKQSVGKTIVKFLLLNLMYMFVLVFFGVFAILFSFLTF